uniref:Uncharacterized protein n=1 Tax=Rhizophora mucronata TaxID=61149 RepID=A0A2P2QZT0_RHIMU
MLYSLSFGSIIQKIIRKTSVRILEILPMLGPQSTSQKSTS